MNFGNLPGWVKILLALLALALVAGAVFAATILPGSVLAVLGGGVVLVFLLLILYFLLLKFLDKRKSGRMALALGKHNTAASGVSSAANRAKLDDLRKTFEDGVQKFRNAGKDLYSLPWYAVVGEPGSGKTEAIRHSNVGFPPGLQDELQGTGGTINMNWWFTNHAVFLDTAGRLIFEDVQPGSTNEWQEFLKLLRRARPNCPINGMLLCIPSDTLIKDSQEELDQKARKLAGQLADIQRTLDIRFPVFILVTKSDLVPGFREFFENIHDPRLQHQMVGWANPRPLDEPFHPDELEQLLDDYMHALYRKRLGLIEDPNPVQLGGKRIDEVDTLFTYPSSLQSIFPRLRRYLETIFAAGEWSQKPLFLRGIYFTSSLQEGSALDEELAKALDLPVDELPEGKVWEKEKAYFLRDLCMEKVFKESRLVTRATNAKKQLRQRQMILVWTGVAALLGLVAFAFYGAQSMRDSIGSQLLYWKYLEDPGSVGNDPEVPPVVYEGREAGTYFNNAEGTIDLRDSLLTLEEFHLRLRLLAEEEVEIPVIFKMLFLDTATREQRLAAQRAAFERYVLQPLVDSARDKMANIVAADWTPAATDALVLLLQIERELADREAGIPPDPLGNVSIINPLMQFLTGEAVEGPLPAVLEQTYFSPEAESAGAQWPPPWISGGRTLRENTAVAAGLQAYLAHHRARLEPEVEGIEALRAAFDPFEELGEIETALLEEARALDSANDLEDLLAIYERYRRGRAILDRSVADLAAIYAEEDAPGFSLFQAYRASLESALGGMEDAISELEQRLGGGLPELETRGERGGGMEGYPLFVQVGQVIARERGDFIERLTSALTEEQVGRLRDFDARDLELERLVGPYSYVQRAEIYDRVLNGFADAFNGVRPGLGSLSSALEGPLEQRESILEELEEYDGGRAIDLEAAGRNVLNFYQARGMRGVAEQYRTAVRDALAPGAGFPLVLGPDAPVLDIDTINGFIAALDALDADRESPAFALFSEDDRAAITALADRYGRLGEVAAAFVTPNGNSRRCRIILGAEPAQRELLALFYPERNFNAVFAGMVYRDVSVNDSERARSFLESDAVLETAQVTDSLLAMNFFQFAESGEPEEVIRLDEPWAPVRLVLNNRSVRAEPKVGESFTPGEVWHVLMELPSVGADPKAMVLTVSFSQPLPAPDAWPEHEAYSIN